MVIKEYDVKVFLNSNDIHILEKLGIVLTEVFLLRKISFHDTASAISDTEILKELYQKLESVHRKKCSLLSGLD